MMKNLREPLLIKDTRRRTNGKDREIMLKTKRKMDYRKANSYSDGTGKKHLDSLTAKAKGIQVMDRRVIYFIFVNA